MERGLRIGERRDYAAAVADLWEGLGSGLSRLERTADAPVEEIAANGSEELRSLQYSLHAGAELAHGISPPPDSQTVHAELVAALAQARDATAEVVAALEDADREHVERLVPEWRGALFRVRLARLRALQRAPFRLAGADAPEAHPLAETFERPVSGIALVATTLVLAGALIFTAGAVLAAWPLWAAGLMLFAGGFVLFRP